MISRYLSPFRGNNVILGIRPLLVGSVAFLGFSFANVQKAAGEGEWVAPAERAQRSNPIAATESSRAAGRKIYLARCAACHGETGDGRGHDALEFGLHPAKFSDPKLNLEADGALYWKITTGKRPMPDYGSRLSATDRWNVINYLRVLSQGKYAKLLNSTAP